MVIRLCIHSSSDDSVGDAEPAENQPEQINRPSPELSSLGLLSKDREEPHELSIQDLWQGEIEFGNSFTEFGKCMWYEEEGYSHTIGIINSSPDSRWCHISFFAFFVLPLLHSCNGVMDLVVAKHKNCCRDAEMALRYVVRQEFNCDLMEYVRVKALELNSSTDEVIMLDGEVFPGPNPFRFVCIPCLLTVFGEYFSVFNKHTKQSSALQTSSSPLPATLR